MVIWEKIVYESSIKNTFIGWWLKKEVIVYNNTKWHGRNISIYFILKGLLVSLSPLSLSVLVLWVRPVSKLFIYLSSGTSLSYD